MSARGFTLIEVVLVAAVLAVLLAASLPRFRQTADRLRVEQRAFEFAQLLRYARERAVAQGRDVLWRWDDEARRVSLQVLGDDGRFHRLEERQASSTPLTPDVAFRFTTSDPSTGCDCVRFSPDGTTAAASLRLTLDELAYTVTVDGTTGQAALAAGRAAR